MAVLERVSIGSLAQGAVPPGYTFTRSTTALYVDSDGLLKSAAINTPRRQWDATNRRWGYVGEGSRTNYCTYSQDFSAVGAHPQANTTVTVAGTTAPDGTTTGNRIQATATSATTMREQANVVGTAASYSVFVKKGTSATIGNAFSLRNVTTATDLITATVNLDTGAIAYSVGSSGCVAEDWGNGWWRVSLSASSGITSGDAISGYAGARSTALTAGDHWFLWQCQLENGPAPSSPIPTTTVAVTRGADLQARALTGPEGTALSTQGTMVVEFSYLGGDNTISANSRAALVLDDGTSSNRNNVSNRTGGTGGQSVLAGSNIATPFVAGAFAVGTVLKAAMTWKSNDIQAAVNGSHGTRVTSGAATLPTVSNISIGSQSNGGLIGSVLVYGWAIYDDAKTDAELQALTTPTTNRNQSRLTLGLGLGL